MTFSGRERSSSRKGRVLAGTGLSLGAALGVTASAGAQSVLEVDNTSNNAAQQACTLPNTSDCSLPGAINNSNTSDPNTETIVFASSLSGQTITLTTGLNIYDGVTIDGPGANNLTISGGDTVRHFYADLTNPGEPVVIKDLTLVDGNAGIFGGGAIANADASLEVVNSNLISNEAGDGGGISSAPAGALKLTSSTLSGNTATNKGGGVHVGEGTVELSRSTIAGNYADAIGGGLFAEGDVGLNGSTVSGNGAGVDADGIYAGDSAGDSAVIIGSIIANNGDDLDRITAENVFFGWSLLEDPTGLALAFVGPAITGVDPQLGPLQNNGGPVPTLRPALTSPVIDQGNSNTLTLDQRGLPRPVDVPSVANASGPMSDAADMGSVELTLAEATPPAATTPVTPATPSVPAKKKKKKKKKKKRK